MRPKITASHHPQVGDVYKRCDTSPETLLVIFSFAEERTILTSFVRRKVCNSNRITELPGVRFMMSWEIGKKRNRERSR